MKIDDLATLIENNKINEFKKCLSTYSDSELKVILNTTDSCENYLTHIAIKSKQADLLQWLLEMGADENNKNYWGSSAFDLAFKLEYKTAIDIIHQFRESITNPEGKTTEQPCENTQQTVLQKPTLSDEKENFRYLNEKCIEQTCEINNLKRQIETLQEEVLRYESKSTQLMNTIISEAILTHLSLAPRANISQLNIPDEIKSDSKIEAQFKSLVSDLKNLQKEVIQKFTYKSATQTTINEKTIAFNKINEKRKNFIELKLHKILKEIQINHWMLKKYTPGFTDIQITQIKSSKNRLSETKQTENFSITINGSKYHLEFENVRKTCSTPDDEYLICHKSYVLKHENQELLASITWPYEYDVKYGIENDKKFEEHNITAFKNGEWIQDMKFLDHALCFAENEKKRIREEEIEMQRNAAMEQLKQNFGL